MKVTAPDATLALPPVTLETDTTESVSLSASVSLDRIAAVTSVATSSSTEMLSLFAIGASFTLATLIVIVSETVCFALVTR